MKRLTIYTIHLISGLLLALLTAGCVADRNVSDCITEGEDVELEFALQVPALETSLRQLTADQEKQINSVQVLVFKTDGITDESQEILEYVAPLKDVNTGADGITRIRCGLKATAKPMRVVCIANHNVDAESFVGKTKQLLFEDDQMKKAFTDAWPTDGSKFIPMWGESDKQAVSRTTKFNSCEASNNGRSNTNNEAVIHLVRALARIDVGVSFDETKPADETAKGGSDFKIKSVRVYRYAPSMYVTGTQALTFRMDGNTREPLPHTPADMTAAADTKPLVFEATEGVDGYVRNIYIPEISNEGKGKDARTCLVVGGYYNGSTKETFYRVDFIHTDKNASGQESTKQLDVLRNHRYRFNITKVKGPGTDTPEEALITEPVNISCDVIVWDEAEIDKLMYDGQYYLAVSKDKFHFGKDAASENITIRTNWPKGYKIVDENGTEWAKSEQDAKGTNKWVYFTAPDGQTFAVDKDMTSILNVLDNKTGADREITYKQLFVQAGRIKWPLKVTQSYKTEIDITLYEQDKTTGKLSAEPISHLRIEEGEAHAKLVAVRYTKGANLERLPLTAHEHYIWERIDDATQPGKALYRVTMIAGTAGKEDLNITEVSRFRITKDGAEDYADLSVYYMNYNAVPYRDRALTINMEKHNENYVLINIPARFYIKANAPYKLDIVSITPSPGSTVQDETLVVHDWKTGLTVRQSDGLITGEPINFQPFDWVHGERYKDKSTYTGGLYAATIKFRITSTDPAKHFDPVEFTINLTAGILQPEANCYIMKTTQKVPILIPLSRINTAADWYKQWEAEAEEMARERINIAYKAGITQAQYNEYVNDGRSALPRIEEGNTTNIEAALIWSTIRNVRSLGKVTDSGISILKTVVVDGKSYLMVALADDLEYIDEGNALVGVRQPGKPNEFLWSWHIWVVKDYPWLPVSGHSPGIFMNRNLGAKVAGGGLQSGETHLFYTGLFYQFGRKDPFYADDFTGSDIKGKIPENKIFLGSPTFKSGIMTDQHPKYGKATLNYNKLYTMKQLIRYPYKIAGHDANEEYIVEAAGPNRNRQLGTVLWQGDPVYTRHDKLSRDQIALRTKKTPFDPSPYGWKVPSVGTLEMGRCFELDPTYFVNNGFFKATGQSMEYVGSNIVHLHTATTDIGSAGNAAVFNNGAFMLKPDGRNWQQEFNTSAFYPNAPASALPVRSVVNERETDFKKYTEEGFYDRAAR